MNHKDKLKLARRLNGGKKRNAFLTDAWDKVKHKIAGRVKKTESNMKQMAEERRIRKLKESEAHDHHQ